MMWGDWGSEQDQFNRALRYNIFWNMTTPNDTSSHSCQQKYGWKGVTKKVIGQIKKYIDNQTTYDNIRNNKFAL